MIQPALEIMVQTIAQPQPLGRLTAAQASQALNTLTRETFLLRGPEISDLNDSTSFGNNGTNYSATAASGQIDGGASFSSSEYIDAGNVFAPGTGDFRSE